MMDAEHVHVRKKAWFEIRNRNSNPIGIPSVFLGPSGADW